MLYNLFPIKVYKKKFPGDLKALQEYLIPSLGPIFEESKRHNQASMRGGGICSVNVHRYIHHRFELSELTTFIEETADEYWDLLGYVPTSVKVNHSWANIYPPGSYIDNHNHSPASIVASFYLKKPEMSGNLIFENPISTLLRHQPFKELNDKDGYVSAFDTKLEVNEGDVVLFPGWLMHKTEENISAEERIILGFNMSYATET